MSCARMPMVIVVPVFRLRANRLGLKSSLLMADSTAWRLSEVTRAVPFRMRDTVLGDTPASRATSSRVTAAGTVRERAFGRVTVCGGERAIRDFAWGFKYGNVF